MNVTELKEKLLTSLDLWADARISDMVKVNPALAIPSVYMKRASHNIIAKNKDSWGKSILISFALSGGRTILPRRRLLRL